MKSLFHTANKVALLVCALFAPAWAQGTAADDLSALLEDFDQVRIDFDQTISDSYGRVLENSSGSLAVAKPRARWEVTSPYPQVLIVDDKQLKIFDPDLEQVTERNIEQGWEEIPLALLLGEGSDLQEHFSIVSVPGEGDYSEFLLTPVAEDALFASLTLLVVDNRLSRITIRDHGAQETTILLRNYEDDVVLESEVFELDLPPGTDVIRG